LREVARLVLEAVRFQMPKDPWPKDTAFNKWMSGDRHEDQYSNAQEALEVGFKAGYEAGRRPT